MRNFLQALQAYFLHRMGVPYKQISSILGGAPATHKFRSYILRKSIPQIDEFYDKNVISIPSSLEEQVKLAHELAEKFKLEIGEKEEGKKEKETSVKEDQTIQDASMPTLLLEAIDRSVSTFWHEQDTSDLEEEEEDQKEEKPRRFDLLTTFGFIGGLFGLFSLLLTMINKNKHEEIPVKTGMTNPAIPKTALLSQGQPLRVKRVRSIRRLLERRGIV